MSANVPAVREDALIVRAESLAAWREGERFLEQARQEADMIRSEALAQAETLREQAWHEGYESGQRAAMDEAAELALRISAERESYKTELEPHLVRVIDTALRKILDGIPDQDLVMFAARKAIGELRESGRFTLRVAPGMAAILGEEAMHHLARAVVLRADDSLQESQCFLETPAGIIELTPHAQWERILKALPRAGEENK